MEPVSKYIVANGLRQHYLDWGNSEAQTVLMTHGIGLCAQIWNNTAKELSKEFHVISLDLRA
ncbi:MAG: alpha/beta hydrolase, partial [Dehalococcoidia bacterium]|nr:alpha/beta hydrolase [Dehalococcoidia bacterium]